MDLTGLLFRIHFGGGGGNDGRSGRFIYASGPDILSFCDKKMAETFRTSYEHGMGIYMDMDQLSKYSCMGRIILYGYVLLQSLKRKLVAAQHLSCIVSVVLT